MMIDKVYNVIKTERSKLGRFSIRLDTIQEGSQTYSYSYIECKNSVGVLAFYQGKLILIRQYRHAHSIYELEIAGGSIEDGENPDETAKRELLEETGYKAISLTPLGPYYPTPSNSEKCYLFAAECVNEGKPNREPLEYMDTILLSQDEFIDVIMDGTFQHSMGLVAWLKYKMKIGAKEISC